MSSFVWLWGLVGRLLPRCAGSPVTSMRDTRARDDAGVTNRKNTARTRSWQNFSPRPVHTKTNHILLYVTRREYERLSYGESLSMQPDAKDSTEIKPTMDSTAATEETNHGRADDGDQEGCDEVDYNDEARAFLQSVCRQVETYICPELSSWDFQVIAMDERTIQRLLNLQTTFRAYGKPTNVDIGFHYTDDENLEGIQSNGLLTKADQKESQIDSRQNGASFGDGVYTCNNPFDFKSYGDMGLIVARLQGALEVVNRHVSQGEPTSPTSRRGDTGMAAKHENPRYADVRVLRSSSQCIPLARYDRRTVMQSQAGRRSLYHLQRRLQYHVDATFNGDTVTSVPWMTVCIPSDEKTEVEYFLQFADFLSQYLKEKDQSLHQEVKDILEKCLLNRQGTVSLLTRSLFVRSRLELIVPDVYWTRAEDRFRKDLREPQHKEITTIVYTAPKRLSNGAVENRMVVVDADEVPEEECAICMTCLRLSMDIGELSDNTGASDDNVIAVGGCGHKFHRHCILGALEHGSRCPICRELIREPQGTMPSGKMKVFFSSQSCGGHHPDTGTYVLKYHMDSDIQKKYHPNPGYWFDGCRRTAYIPDCYEGRQLLERLKYAFAHGMTFAVGRSLRTGLDNVITWSSIHHKTCLQGGPHGFPDGSYFDNCNEELDALGVPSASDLEDISENGIDPSTHALIPPAPRSRCTPKADSTVEVFSMVSVCVLPVEGGGAFIQKYEEARLFFNKTLGIISIADQQSDTVKALIRLDMVQETRSYITESPDSLARSGTTLLELNQRLQDTAKTWKTDQVLLKMHEIDNIAFVALVRGDVDKRQDRNEILSQVVGATASESRCEIIRKGGRDLAGSGAFLWFDRFLRSVGVSRTGTDLK